MSPAPKIPTYKDLFEPTVRALEALGGSGNVQEIYNKVCELAGYSEEQQSVLHKDGPQTAIAYRLAWARTYLKANGILDNIGRGVWSLTGKGSDLDRIDATKIRRQAQRTLKRKPSVSEVSDSDLDAISLAPESNDADSEAWIEDLLVIVQKMPPDAFERLCQRLLRKTGFIKVEVTGRKGDGGIDGIGVLKMALLSFQVFFQCKRYSGSVGPSEIRDFRGAMVGRTDKGLFITTGTFTSAAKQEAIRDGAPALDLIDGVELCQLLKEHQLGVATKTVEIVTFNRDWFNQL